MEHINLLNEYQNLLKKINNGNVGNTCSLCLQNPVNKYFNPCGHTACDKCIDHLYEKSEDVYNVNCFLDIVIPLNPILKKNRETHKRFAEAMRDMMNSDVQLKKKKSKSWV